MYPRLVNLLRLIWLLAVVWYELGTFYNHTSSCPWPDKSLLSATPDAQSVLPITHVLVVADPQILDHRSYPDRPPWLMRLSQFIVDLNIRKSWRAALQRRPDAVIFLGDMMDNGRLAMSDAEYQSYFRRFKSIFAAGKDLPVYNLPGNHDIGLGVSSVKYQFSEHARDRYTSHFGPLNQQIVLANHTVWLIDAPGLVDEERERAATGMSFAQWAETRPDRTIAFVDSLTRGADPKDGEEAARPILFTHVPLFRPEDTPCGPLRERGTLSQGRGLGYQNLIGPQASQFLLQSIRPAIIFGGDDHDYCEYVHTVPATDVRRPPTSVSEITVKSFSMAMGIRLPGYQLLSLIPPSASRSDRSLAHQPCLLPDQLGIYLSVYIPLLVLTLIALIVSNSVRMYRLHSTSLARPQSIPLASVADTEIACALLPPSASASKPYRRDRCSFGFTIGGRRRRVTIVGSVFFEWLLSFLWTGRVRDDEKYKRRGIVGGFVRDTRDAACAPLALFVGIAWWVR